MTSPIRTAGIAIASLVGTMIVTHAQSPSRPQEGDGDKFRFRTGVELINYEDLGFCEKWGAAKLIEERETYVGGRIPVNPSGGLKAKGHPPGATGVAQCVEIFEQVRGESTNQVDGAKIGLTHNIGGPTAVSAITILSSDKG